MTTDIQHLRERGWRSILPVEGGVLNEVAGDSFNQRPLEEGLKEGVSL
jgi:hypothetical protein